MMCKKSVFILALICLGVFSINGLKNEFNPYPVFSTGDTFKITRKETVSNKNFIPLVKQTTKKFYTEEIIYKLLVLDTDENGVLKSFRLTFSEYKKTEGKLIKTDETDHPIKGKSVTVNFSQDKGFEINDKSSFEEIELDGIYSALSEIGPLFMLPSEKIQPGWEKELSEDDIKNFILKGNEKDSIDEIDITESSMKFYKIADYNSSKCLWFDLNIEMDFTLEAPEDNPNNVQDSDITTSMVTTYWIDAKKLLPVGYKGSQHGTLFGTILNQANEEISFEAIINDQIEATIEKE